VSKSAYRAARSAYWVVGVFLIVTVVSPTAPTALADSTGFSSDRTKIFSATANKQVRKGLEQSTPAAPQVPEKDAKRSNKRSSGAMVRSSRLKSRKQRTKRAALVDPLRVPLQPKSPPVRLQQTGTPKQQPWPNKSRTDLALRKLGKETRAPNHLGILKSHRTDAHALQRERKVGNAVVAGVEGGKPLYKSNPPAAAFTGHGYANDIKALIDAQGAEWWTLCLMGASRGGQDAMAALQSCARRTRGGLPSIGGSSGGRSGPGFGGLGPVPASDADCKGTPAQVGPGPRATYDPPIGDENRDGDTADERARYHLEQAAHHRREARRNRAQAARHSNPHLRRLATRAAEADEAAADAHDEAADAAQDLDVALHGSAGDPVDAGPSDRATRRAKKASVVADKAFNDYADASFLRENTQPPAGPDEQRVATWQSSRCNGMKADAARGQLWSNKDYCGDDDPLTCIRRTKDTVAEVTDDACGVEIGPNDAAIVRCNDPRGKTDPQAGRCPADDPTCISDGVGSGNRPGSRRRSGGRGGSVPWGYVETTKFGQSLERFCANGGCGETWHGRQR
jgi:hypothetical protein